jgi:hypothetical protein
MGVLGETDPLIVSVGMLTHAELVRLGEQVRTSTRREDSCVEVEAFKLNGKSYATNQTGEF